jgi:hypothetical protein
MLPLACLLAACTPAQDPQAFIDQELSFLRPGVQLEAEEREVRRVLAQRGLRVNARVAPAGFTALSALSRDRRLSALRVITARGVVVAEDAATDDLFQPGTISLLEHFGGTIGEFALLAYARVPLGQDAGCVTLQRILPDANAAACVLDVSRLGARACVSNLGPSRAGRMRATVAWPSLHAFTTPQLDVELAFDDPYQGLSGALMDEQQLPRVSVVPVARISMEGGWVERERNKFGARRVGKADFSLRHATGLARAALARLSGQGIDAQLNAYRNAVGDVLSGSAEALVVADTTRHIQNDWLDAAPTPGPPARDDPEVAPVPAPEPEDLPEDSLVIEPSAP